jgi:hypothetical protein
MINLLLFGLLLVAPVASDAQQRTMFLESNRMIVSTRPTTSTKLGAGF